MNMQTMLLELETENSNVYEQYQTEKKQNFNAAQAIMYVMQGEDSNESPKTPSH